MNKRKIGDAGESFVVDFLNKEGLLILERNFVTRHGEIDIIFKDGNYIVFSEVKERFGKNYGSSFEAVNYKKIKSILYSSRVYLFIHGYKDSVPVRFDVFAIQNGEINWIKNAFSF